MNATAMDTMSRKAKRPVTAREPSGRPQRESEYSPAHIKRARDEHMRKMGDPIYGTEIGRLRLENCITEDMYKAGLRWGEHAHKYRSSIGLFPARSAKLELASHATDTDPDSEEGQKVARRDANAAEAFFEAHSVLLTAGRLTESTVRRVCEDDEILVGLLEYTALRAGLSALAQHYGLTGRGKSEYANVR